MPPFKQRPKRGGQNPGSQNRRSDFNTRLRPDQNNPADWQRQYDRYCALARDAVGVDEVSREHYWQYAEHFRRLMNGSASYT